MSVGKTKDFKQTWSARHVSLSPQCLTCCAGLRKHLGFCSSTSLSKETSLDWTRGQTRGQGAQNKPETWIFVSFACVYFMLSRHPFPSACFRGWHMHHKVWHESKSKLLGIPPFSILFQMYFLLFMLLSGALVMLSMGKDLRVRRLVDDYCSADVNVEESREKLKICTWSSCSFDIWYLDHLDFWEIAVLAPEVLQVCQSDWVASEWRMHIAY